MNNATKKLINDDTAISSGTPPGNPVTLVHATIIGGPDIITYQLHLLFISFITMLLPLSLRAEESN